MNKAKEVGAVIESKRYLVEEALVELLVRVESLEMFVVALNSVENTPLSESLDRKTCSFSELWTDLPERLRDYCNRLTNVENDLKEVIL